jgi:predicted AAA+ superfamily ATPase
MYRENINELRQWKENPQRKPLIVRGARQVGKTWIIKEFGKNFYNRTVYVNFENTPELRNLFLRDLNPERIITALEIFAGFTIVSEDTLIVFDEIQAAERGVTSLKYFCEDAPQYHVVAAGSLLGIAVHKNASFPVGKVNFIDMYPMSFLEFLIALGEEKLSEIIRQKQWDIVSVFSGRLRDYLKYYYYTGGMPEAVLEFSQSRNWKQIREIQKNILLSYENDFSKHAPVETVPRIRMVWQSIPSQLAKENKKFVYGVIREGARAKDFELAIQWLLDCGLLLKNNRVSKPFMPLVAYQGLSVFKLYLNDVGLLGAMNNLDVRTLIEGNSIFTEFKGAFTEQYVMQQLALQKDISICYWTNERSTSEVDFVIQKNGEITAVEVKSGENLHAKSFKTFCEKYRPDRAIRTSPANYREEEWFTNVPLYAVGQF